MEQKVKDSRRLRREKRGNDFFKKLESQEQSEFKKTNKKTRGRMKKRLGEDGADSRTSHQAGSN